MKKVLFILYTLILLTSFTSCDFIIEESDIKSNTAGETVSLDSQDVINTFIDIFNEKSDTYITDVLEIDIHDKDQGHYRTAYRLLPFENAVAINGNIGEYSIDIVNYGSMSNDQIRLYLSTDSVDFAEMFFDIAIKIFDSSLNESDITNANESLRNQGNGNYLNDITFYYNSKELFIDCSNVDFFNNK